MKSSKPLFLGIGLLVAVWIVGVVVRHKPSTSKTADVQSIVVGNTPPPVKLIVRDLPNGEHPWVGLDFQTGPWIAVDDYGNDPVLDIRIYRVGSNVPEYYETPDPNKGYGDNVRRKEWRMNSRYDGYKPITITYYPRMETRS